MQPAAKLSTLQERWQRAIALVIEEISMVSSVLYHMLDFRSMLGRQAGHAVSQQTYAQTGQAFGRIPIVLHLGDFLQLPPVAGTSLVADLQAKLPDGSYKYPSPSLELQQGQKVFREIGHIFELFGTRRFEPGDPLAEFLECMRAGPDTRTGQTFPAHIWAAFEKTFAADNVGKLDPRHAEPKFADGYGMAIHWETLCRWIPQRAMRDARKLGKPLVCLQCVDESEGLDDVMAWRLLNRYNIYETGKIHGILPAHEGMWMRLTEKVDADLGLVQEARGMIVEFVFHDLDQQRYEATGPGELFQPDYLPLGKLLVLLQVFFLFVWGVFLQDLEEACAW